jgi:hypothetical protein
MAKVWVLDTETKGTGAEMVPLEKVLERRAGGPKPAPHPGRRKPERPARQAEPRKPRPQPQQHSTPLPPGHVRKKVTGEIGRVQSIDAKAGTASVFWLRQGRASTVPLASVTRR